MFSRIVVGVDGQPGGRAAVTFAATIARATAARLLLVHVHPCPPLLGAWRGNGMDEQVRRDAQAVLDDAAGASSLEAEAIAVSASSPARGLHEQAEAWRADLLVVGSSHGSAARRLVGHTARAVLHGAPCAVALVPTERVGHPGQRLRIAVGYDGTSDSLAAVRCAADLARASGSSLDVLRCVTPPTAFSPRSAYCIDWPDLTERSRAQAQSDMDVLIAGLPVPARGVVSVGTPAKLLGLISQEVDLLVLGSRGFGPVRRLLLGSTAQVLVGHACCPVMILPREARPLPTMTPGSSDASADRDDRAV